MLIFVLSMFVVLIFFSQSRAKQTAGSLRSHAGVHYHWSQCLHRSWGVSWHSHDFVILYVLSCAEKCRYAELSLRTLTD